MIKSKLFPNWPAFEQVAKNDAKMKAASAASSAMHHRAKLLPQIGQDTQHCLSRMKEINRRRSQLSSGHKLSTNPT